ncbi:MAG: DUF835 domain-containing protein [Thermoplasmata archaeon]
MGTAYYIYAAIYLSITLALLYVAHRGYWSNPKRRENKYFLFLCLAGVIWGFAETAYWLCDDVKLLIAIIHLDYVGAIMTGPVFFLLANAVPIWRPILNKKWVIYLISGIILFFEVICLTNPFTHIYISSFYEFENFPGKYGSNWTVFWWGYAAVEYTFFIAGFISLALSIKQARTKIEKSQARILVLAVVIPFIGNAFELTTRMLPDPTTIFMSITAMLFGYALTKYKLMAIAPVVERKDGIPEKLPISIDRGLNYLVLDDHTNSSYFALRLLSTEKPGLCVTGKAPDVVRTAFKIEKLPIIWITEVETEEQSANPARLDFEITQSIINFMRENPGASVLIDDIEYLTIKCGFDAVTNFLKDIADVASTTSSTFIVQIRPSFYDDEKRRILTSMFDRKLTLPEIYPVGKGVERTVLHYRDEKTLEKIATEIPETDKVLVITRTHPKKIERHFKNAEYYWITDLDISNVKTIRPEAVETDFILAIKNAIRDGVKHVVIDGCDVVKIKISLDKYISFIKDITDLAHKYGVKLYCVVEVSDDKENVVICSRFDRVVK